jgi:hypothetical protein
MALATLKLRVEAVPLPADVSAFLKEAERRVEGLQADCRYPAFIASNFPEAYRALRAVADDSRLRGRLFCEWGSGLGVIAGLAAMLDFDACGIECEAGLVDAARSLCRAFELPVQFAQGSYIPRGGHVHLPPDLGHAWLDTDTPPADDELGLSIEDFDLIFAYPWPDEEDLTGKLFESYAAPGALLLTHHGGDEFRLRRKV